MTQTSNPDRSVPTRRISFEKALRTVPRHFGADGDLIASHVVAALSAVFPDGEDFFVRSVRHFRDQITDPALRRQVAGFIGQEATHGREHRAFNDRLHELGYPMSLLGDPATYRGRTLWASWQRFRQSPLISRVVWDQLRDYNRSDFHPDDRDTAALVDAWRDKLFGDSGTLAAKLITTAA